MGTCSRCGKHGIFLPLSEQGLCSACERKEKLELYAQLEEAKAQAEADKAALNAQLEEAKVQAEADKEALTAQLEEAKAGKEELTAQLEETKKLLTPEHMTRAQLLSEIARRKAQIENCKEKETEHQKRVKELERQIRKLEKEIVDDEDTIEIQESGIYTPKYNLMRADEYRARLLEVRAKQSDMIKQHEAVNTPHPLSFSYDQKKGMKINADITTLLLRAFNIECDDVIEHVRYGNIEASEKKITVARTKLNKIGETLGFHIHSAYYRLKIEELYLAYEYESKKQEEKEQQKEARALLREEAKVARELEEARRRLEKEQRHYQNALKQVKLQELCATGEQSIALAEKRLDIENTLQKIDKEFADIDYRAANQRAGYVYVISNVGSFGEGIYKIGMTRRLDPMERVYELSDASVPFNFDVHAMIFSDDAPTLEAALHAAFADRKINFVNPRREFFRVSLAEIKKEIRKNYDKTVEFVDEAPAEQYRQSQALKKQQEN